MFAFPPQPSSGPISRVVTRQTCLLWTEYDQNKMQDLAIPPHTFPSLTQAKSTETKLQGHSHIIFKDIESNLEHRYIHILERMKMHQQSAGISKLTKVSTQKSPGRQTQKSAGHPDDNYPEPKVSESNKSLAVRLRYSPFVMSF